MKTTINSEERVFQIYRKGFFVRVYFCNLHEIPLVINAEFEKHDAYIISEFWNNKFKRCSKKHLNEMFEANKINFKIS